VAIGPFASSGQSAGPGRVADRLEALVRAQEPLLRVLDRRLGNRADALDVMQAALLKAAERIETVRDDQRLLAWFRRIVLNTLADRHRQRRAGERLRDRLGAIGTMEAGVETEELFWATCECLRATLPTLRPEYAGMIQRVDLDGVRLRQVAEDLGITASNAAVRLHRARRALARKLRDVCRACPLHWRLDCACRGDADLRRRARVGEA
jgi:RNA polymerase sigma factor (sigma-70 family)